MQQTSPAALAYLQPLSESNMKKLNRHQQALNDFVEKSLQDLQELSNNCQQQYQQAQAQQNMTQSIANLCTAQQIFVNAQISELDSHLERVKRHINNKQSLIAQTLVSQLRIKAEAMQEQANAAASSCSSSQLQAQSALGCSNAAQAFAESARQMSEVIASIANDIEKESPGTSEAKQLQLSSSQAKTLYNTAQSNALAAGASAMAAQAAAQSARYASVNIQQKSSYAAKLATEAYDYANEEM